MKDVLVWGCKIQLKRNEDQKVHKIIIILKCGSKVLESSAYRMPQKIKGHISSSSPHPVSFHSNKLNT